MKKTNKTATDRDDSETGKFFHYGQNNGTSTLKIGEQSVEVSHDYQQWQWWVWVLIIVPALVLLCLCMKCLCR